MNLETITPSVYIIILTMVLVIDKRYHIIPNKIVYPSIILALVLSGLGGYIISSLIGGAIMFLYLLLSLLIFKIKVGIGDIKYGLLVGLMVGYPLVFINIFITGMLSILTVIFLLVTKRGKLTDMLPYGVVMSIATMATILFGGMIWEMITNLKY